ncbi:MAG: hydantoinase B/oxoprolinase family protein [Chloroflexota bacterium]
MSSIDPITTQVIRNALRAAAQEMQTSLIKTAHNPLIYEVQDFGVAMTNHRGQLISEGSGLPGFLACLPPTIQAGIAAIGAQNFREGDVILTNEPYDTGTHISDTVIYLPIFYEEKLVAFAAIMAHWADIGGIAPGGWCPDSTSVHQEGMLFTHHKLYDAGKPNAELLRFILKNVRYPDLVEGDLHAKIAACQTGARRYHALCDRYGAETLTRAMDIVFEQSEARMRREIGAIPDGVYQAETYMDHDGVEIDKLRKIAVTVTVHGDEMHIDWTGTDEVAAGPINHPFVGTEALCATTLKSLTMPFDPMNDGHIRPLTVTAPRHTVVSAEYPAPCDSYGYVAEAIVHLIIRALSTAIPDRCPACTYQMFAYTFSRTDPRHGDPFIYGEPVDGGSGAFPHDDGPSGIMFVGNGDAPNTSAEVVESLYPMLIRRYAINTGDETSHAGVGQYRGGYGVIRDIEVCTDHVHLQTSNENTKYTAWGLFGGHNADASHYVLYPDTEREQVMTERITDYGPLMTGDRLSVRTGGGGGWGDPQKRDPARIAADIRNGLMTEAQAKAVYGYRES